MTGPVSSAPHSCPPRAERSHPTRPVRLLGALLLGLAVLFASAAPDAWAATAVPAGLKAVSATSTTVTVKWSAVKGAPKYRVQYSTSASMAKATYKRVSGTSTVLSGLKPATRYYVKVRVISTKGANLSSYSKATTATTASAAPAPTTSALRLGSFNIKCFNCMGTQPNERSWWDRRADVVSTILAQKVDVLGVQEASQAWLPAAPGGPGQDLSQFEDLRNRLGGTWQLTNANRYNCARSKSTSGCVVTDQGASAGTKILYDSNRVDLLRNGSRALTSAGSTVRYMAWAEFRQRSTGKKFFFADAHLEPNKDWILHRTEAREVAATVQTENTGKLPTFVVGDMNSGKNSLNPSGVRDNAVYDVMVDQYHYVDPLGNRSGTTTTPIGATVERRINTPLNSYNDFTAVPSPLYYGANARPNGTYIDYIFTSPKVRVAEWETVAKLDANHHYVGKQASDHNMIRATVVLP